MTTQRELLWGDNLDNCCQLFVDDGVPRMMQIVSGGLVILQVDYNTLRFNGEVITGAGRIHQALCRAVDIDFEGKERAVGNKSERIAAARGADRRRDQVVRAQRVAKWLEERGHNVPRSAGGDSVGHKDQSTSERTGE